jgi:MATE family multidrug resistance protein
MLSRNIGNWDACRRLFALALPMTGSQLINVASGFFCVVMLAQLGPEVLAASALVFSTDLSIMVTGFSILFSLSVLIGHAYGEKKYLAIGVFVQQGWMLSLLISIPILLIFWYIKPILLFLGQSKEITELVQLYFHAFLWCVIPELLVVCNQQFGYGIHKKLLMVSTSILSVIVLLCTAYVLIFGKFGCPQLGIAGLGYARAAQNTFFFLFTTSFFYYSKDFSRFQLFKFRVHHHLEQLFHMLAIGWPISIQMGGEMLSFFVTGLMIGWLGATSLAAFQVVNQYSFIVMISIFSLSQASGILVGQAVGAKQSHEVKKLGYVSMACVLVVTSLVALLFILAPKILSSLYLNVQDPNNRQTLAYIAVLFIIVAISQIFDGLRHILTGVLRGLFDTRFPMGVGLFVIWIIGVPLSYYLAFILHLGVVGVVGGGGIAMLIGSFVLLYRWHVLSRVIASRP